MIHTVKYFGVVNKLVMVMVISYGSLHLSSYYQNYCITMRNETIKNSTDTSLGKSPEVWRLASLEEVTASLLQSGKNKSNWKDL